MLDPDLFDLSSDPRARMEPLADGLPVLLIDDLFRDPVRVRDQALELAFEPPADPYPGRIAALDPANPSLAAFLAHALGLVNRDYLPALPRDRGLAPLTRVHSDFAIVDRHPDELAGLQRVPHVDPVPIFGLVYLNRDDRGGTLFFRRTAEPAASPAAGYVTASRDGFELSGRIEPAFNRLAIYPGFVPHSGDISGDWIRSDERHRSPRLTQRLLFG